MRPDSAISGLYVIADTQTLTDNLTDAVAAAIEGGARLVQYRDKSDDAAKRLRQASALRALCHHHGIPFIVNDDVNLAHQCAADGIHLGKGDASIESARKQLGQQSIVGYSCYNDIERARHAVTAGATYIAFGSFYSSEVKPDAAVASNELLAQAKREFTLPIVAIGGITPENGTDLVAAGADVLAVITGVFSADNIQGAARQYAALFSH